jgi:hypothetical protein
MTKDGALRLALEALEDLRMKQYESTGELLYKETFNTIKKALEIKDEYELGFIDGMQKQMQSSVDKAVNAMGNREWVGLTPLHIEDEYVRNYLWERALVAIDDPCTKSHPHENMNEYCQHKTAQLQKERNT